VKKWIAEIAGSDFPVTLSHLLGGIGSLERENSAVLNTALKRSLRTGFLELKKQAEALGLNCPLFIVQNNGTVMTLAQAVEFPVLTIGSGPRNSFIGGAKLAGVRDGVIADVGGTSTDVGIVFDYFARQSLNTSQIAGIPLNFPMPDTIAIALGGGSHLSFNANGIEVGPRSLGRKLLQASKSFGGSQHTLTDAAIALNSIQMKGAERCLSDEVATECLLMSLERIKHLYQRMVGSSQKLPFVLVGGGAKLFPTRFLESEQIVVPPHSESANAYGAALSEISATIDRVISLNDRVTAIETLELEAIAAAKRNGASEPRIVEKTIIPYHYIPGNLARILLTASGKVNFNAI
jgi:N-methylhydantoinase A/oxoprolinase/acetone carboxylase beta subunit